MHSILAIFKTKKSSQQYHIILWSCLNRTLENYFTFHRVVQSVLEATGALEDERVIGIVVSFANHFNVSEPEIKTDFGHQLKNRAENIITTIATLSLSNLDDLT